MGTVEFEAPVSSQVMPSIAKALEGALTIARDMDSDVECWQVLSGALAGIARIMVEGSPPPARGEVVERLIVYLRHDLAKQFLE